MKKILVFFIFFFLITFFSFTLNAKTFQDIAILGNKKISNSTIIDIIDFDKNINYTAEEINEFQKKLFKTSFFRNVEINFSDEVLKIIVKENPIIDFFYISGILNKDLEEIVYENISLGPNKIFSESLLVSDIQKIKSIFNETGYYNADVSSDISQVNNDIVNLVINVNPNNKIKIKNIAFIGDKKEKSSRLKDVISSSPHGWWKFFSNVSTLSDKRVEYDKFLLKEYYLNQGYYDVQVTSSDINFINESYAELVYSINSGSIYFFSGFNIIDEYKNLSIVDKENILKIIFKKLNNKKYSKSLLRSVESQINNYIDTKKIDFLDLDLSITKIEDNKIKIDFIFNKNDPKYINLINIKGNSITEEKVIRRGIDVSEGDSLLNYKLRNSKRNLYNSRIFKDVNIDVKNISDDLVNLDITVEEQPTGSISAGLGVGSTESTIGGNLIENNLFGMGIKSDVNIIFGTQRIRGNFDISIPDFANTNNTFNFRGFATKSQFDNTGYESTKYGTGVSTSYPIYDNVFLTIGAAGDLENIQALSNASDLTKKQAGDYTTLKLSYDLAQDTRNSNFLTTSGQLLRFGQNYSTLLSEVPYVDTNISASHYNSVDINNNFVLNLRGGLSNITSFGSKDIKLSDRKFLSQKKLRGFESFGVGPIDNSNHIGGNNTLYSSVSSTFPNPFPEKANATTSIFYDIGNVWGVDFDNSLDSDKIRSSAGITLDWMSPIGPISFVYAEVLSSETTDKEESFSFQLGSSF